MRSLFVKIFFSFWLSTVLIVSLSVLTSERPRFDQAHQAWRSMVGRAVAMDSYEVVKLYNEQGCANVPQYLTALNKSTNVRAFLFDGGGALLAKMLFNLFAVLDFRQMNGGRFVAVIALHILSQVP